VVGITRFGDLDSLDDGGTISFAPDTAIAVLNTGVAGWGQVLVRTSTDAAAVGARLRETLPASVDVVSGDDFRADQRAQASGLVDLLRPALNGFAYLALFVAGFVIFNTFSVVVTQRFRELALIRAVGGTPGQVRRSLLLEGLAVGVVASALGIVAGALLALVVQVVLGWLDIELPGAGLSVTPGTVLLCLVAGTVVTVLSVFVPAFRAGRTRPVEAMRVSAVDRSGTSRARAVIGGAALVLGIVLLLVHRLADAPWIALVGGALSLFVGLVVGGPLLARVFGRLMARPMRALGLTGRLAVDNTVRNPRRTATTANALVIGLFLVTLVTVSGDALKTWTVDQLNRLSSSDYIVAGDGTPISPELAEQIAATDGVAAAAPVRTAGVLTEGGSILIVSGADLETLQETSGLAVVSGSLAGVQDGSGAAVVDLAGLGGGGGGGTGGSAGPGEDRPIASLPSAVGDVVTVVAADGTTVPVRVEATLEAKIDSLFLGTLVSEDTFATLAGDQPISQVFVRAESDQVDAVGGRLERALRGYTGVEVAPGNFLGQIVGQVFDFLIATVNALLGMSVVIALIGIVNTLTLSLYERRAELGTVRALGMTTQQVGRMVRLEAVLIGILGTLVGMAAGLLLGWVVVGSLSTSIDLSINWARLGLIAAAGVVVGVLASLLPARRAVRLDMLDAMRAT
jgi:putative ABC transport system permease protein